LLANAVRTLGWIGTCAKRVLGSAGLEAATQHVAAGARLGATTVGEPAGK
jgi:hypothetical protein